MSLRGLIYTRQFPNPEQPHRGTFVVEQMRATAQDVAWRTIAPVPWVPKALARVMDRPYVRGSGTVHGVHVDRPRYVVLPRRALYSTVAGSMARASRRAFAAAVADHRPAFVHAHELYPSGAAAARLAARAGIPLVVTVHGSDLYSNLARSRWRDALASVASSAHTIICVGSKLAEDTVRALRIDAGKVVTVPDCYDDTALHVAVRDLPVGRPVRLLTVGRLVPEKGIDVLLHAAAGLVSEGYDIQLRIAGGGFLSAELRALARSLGLEKRAVILGAVTSDDLRREFAEADLYVQPSRREGFGLALVEAQATGLVAVATRSGGPSDIVTDETGVLVTPDDVPALVEGIIEGLARLPDADPHAIGASMQARFGRDAVASALLEIYERVASAGGAR